MNCYTFLDEPCPAEIKASGVELSDRDLFDVTEYVFEARDKWKEIGSGLGIPVDKLQAIETDYKKVADCLREMLTYWLRQPDLNRNYRSLAKSLSGKQVGRSDLAKDLPA